MNKCRTYMLLILRPISCIYKQAISDLLGSSLLKTTPPQSVVYQVNQPFQSDIHIAHDLPTLTSAMSLSQLPTELDSRIACYLVGDSTTLSAFSEVSKYYRVVVEPHLYSRLEFSREDEIILPRLLLTLIRREALALHVKYFKLGAVLDADVPTLSQSVKTTQDLQLRDAATTIRDKINAVFDPIQQPKSNLSLAFSVFGGLFSEACVDSCGSHLVYGSQP
jgi:hypothetical protein